MGLLSPQMLAQSIDPLGDMGGNAQMIRSLIPSLMALPQAPQLPQMGQMPGQQMPGQSHGGLLGQSGGLSGLLGGGGTGFNIGGNHGMLTMNGGFGGVNPFTGRGFGSMAPGGQTQFPGGYSAPTDTLNLPS